jgi:hypothetical protein
LISGIARNPSLRGELFKAIKLYSFFLGVEEIANFSRLC